jgi:hypothetical protein
MGIFPHPPYEIKQTAEDLVIFGSLAVCTHFSRRSMTLRFRLAAELPLSVVQYFLYECEAAKV